MSKEVKIEITYNFEEERVYINCNDLDQYSHHQQLVAIDDITFQLDQLYEDLSMINNEEVSDNSNVIDFPKK